MLIVIQRGHVPRKSGATGAPGEQQFATDTAAIAAPLLRAMGHTVRVIDADEPRDQYRGDIFIAVHYDSSSSASASGASVGYQGKPGERLADMWSRAYVAEGWTRGFRADNYSANLAQYYGVREAIAAGNEAAIITESGFHSNPDDDELMTPGRTARSIARAVAEFTGSPIGAPIEEDDMAYTPEDLTNIIRNAVFRHRVPNPADITGDDATFQTWVAHRLARRSDQADVQELAAAIVAKLGSGADVAEIEAAIRRVFGQLDEPSP